jgi:hypothetical protein
MNPMKYGAYLLQILRPQCWNYWLYDVLISDMLRKEQAWSCVFRVKPDIATIIVCLSMFSSAGTGHISWLFYNVLSSAEIV